MAAPRAPRKAAPRKKKRAPATVEVVLTVRMSKQQIQESLGETIFDSLHDAFRGYGKKPAVKVTVAGQEVIGG